MGLIVWAQNIFDSIRNSVDFIAPILLRIYLVPVFFIAGSNKWNPLAEHGTLNPVEGLADVAIWFGILVLIVVGIGLTAPPIGLNVFVISALARHVPLSRTYAGVLPFIAADVLRLALVVAFPGLVLWLVRLLN